MDVAKEARVVSLRDFSTKAKEELLRRIGLSPLPIVGNGEFTGEDEQQEFAGRWKLSTVCGCIASRST